MRSRVWLDDDLLHFFVFGILHDNNIAARKRDDFVLEVDKDVVSFVQSIPAQNGRNLQ